MEIRINSTDPDCAQLQENEVLNLVPGRMSKFQTSQRPCLGKGFHARCMASFHQSLQTENKLSTLIWCVHGLSAGGSSPKAPVTWPEWSHVQALRRSRSHHWQCPGLHCCPAEIPSPCASICALSQPLTCLSIPVPIQVGMSLLEQLLSFNPATNLGTSVTTGRPAAASWRCS